MFHIDVSRETIGGVLLMTKRINVTISDLLNSRIDDYSEEYGMTKSSIMAFIVGQWFDKYDRENGDGSTTSDDTLRLILEAISKVAKKGGVK